MILPWSIIPGMIFVVKFPCRAGGRAGACVRGRVMPSPTRSWRHSSQNKKINLTLVVDGGRMTTSLIILYEYNSPQQQQSESCSYPLSQHFHTHTHTTDNISYRLAKRRAEPNILYCYIRSASGRMNLRITAGDAIIRMMQRHTHYYWYSQLGGSNARRGKNMPSTDKTPKALDATKKENADLTMRTQNRSNRCGDGADHQTYA